MAFSGATPNVGLDTVVEYPAMVLSDLLVVSDDVWAVGVAPARTLEELR